MRSLAVLMLALAACGDPRGDLEALASKEALCETVADCCAVRDGCGAKWYVVGKDDYRDAVELEAELDEACAKCAGTGMQLDCQEGRCVGVALSWSDENTLHESQCGAVDAESVARGLQTGRVLGCGG